MPHLPLPEGHIVTDNKQSQARRIGLGALSAVLLIMVGLFFLPDPAVEPAPEAVVTTQEAVAPAPVVSDAAPATPELETPLAPRFDTFRVELDGAMLIAGRAMPGQQVDVVLGGVVIAQVIADASGNFVAFAQAGPADVPRRLSLLVDPDGAAIMSETSYIVAPIAPVQQVASAPPSPAVVAPPPEDVAPEPDVAGGAPDAPAVPTVLQADQAGISVVQAAPQPVANVALDAITYDPDGDIQLTGRATGPGEVQVYLDNQPIVTSPVTQTGDFRVDLPQVATGIYTLRIDEVNAAGSVVSRIETPFKREEAGDVAAALAEETTRVGFEVAVRTVQPGETLWAIAEQNLGQGIFYVKVFEANRDLIRDPDLIYPGQIFRIPNNAD
ncbi:MAG: LysM peptidoglycan-binding domain-containing protein [Yoonia sp.]|nr:LysM peptidoglycan-binding domain-containing protein [Yoonia sp.]